MAPADGDGAELMVKTATTTTGMTTRPRMKQMHSGRPASEVLFRAQHLEEGRRSGRDELDCSGASAMRLNKLCRLHLSHSEAMEMYLGLRCATAIPLSGEIVLRLAQGLYREALRVGCHGMNQWMLI